LSSASLETESLPHLTNFTDQAISPGHLAYIGADGNVYVTTPDQWEALAVTDDATAPREGGGLSYQRISWSPEGHLAFASVVRTRDDAKSTLYVAETFDQPARVVGQSDNHFVIYIYWSPVACPHTPNCRQLAYLIEEETDIGLHLVEMNGETIDNQIIGFGWPYYFSWSPDGTSILWHTGGSIQENEQAQLMQYDLLEREALHLPLSPAAFLAPAWSPVDTRWLGAVNDGETDQLQLLGESTPVDISMVSRGGTSFAWGPTGTQIAYAVRPNSDHQFYGPIHLFETETQQSRQLTDDGLQILAFFWDPAGERLGYLTLVPMAGGDWMQWRVYDVAQDIDRGFKLFNPSLQMKFVMSSFNQYAQSHRFWSPDGRYLVYASRNEVLRLEQVGVIDTWDEDNSNTTIIAAGTMGFWSWQ
ncbi:MAG: hypothetical protein AAF485_30140, partial [Chloroflexota bacterium]